MSATLISLWLTYISTYTLFNSVDVVATKLYIQSMNHICFAALYINSVMYHFGLETTFMVWYIHFDRWYEFQEVSYP